MGGEKCGLGKTLMQLEGSPPRGRGKAVIFHIHDECVRITPAWAGKRSARCGRWPGPLDHPRVGGEKPGNGWSFGCSGGSPPRGRGKASPCRSSSSGRRITPAWAGKRLFPRYVFHGERDHPRVGGEKHGSDSCSGVCQGSPPRGRGKGHEGEARVDAPGITPAWAGKSPVRSSACSGPQDHPRVGGEKLADLLFHHDAVGSPPRGRGKDNAKPLLVIDTRITPAWAGKRLKRSHRSGIFISGPIPFHSVLHRPAGSGGSRAGRDGSPAGQPQNTGPA